VKFKDSTGQDWVWPKLTTRVLNNLRDNQQVDLRQLLRTKAEEVGEALMDDEKLIAVFMYLCKPQVDERGLTKEQVEDRWDGETNLAARESLVESFFRHSQSQKVTEVLMRRFRGEGTSLATLSESPGS